MYAGFDPREKRIYSRLHRGSMDNGRGHVAEVGCVEVAGAPPSAPRPEMGGHGVRGHGRPHSAWWAQRAGVGRESHGGVNYGSGGTDAGIIGGGKGDSGGDGRLVRDEGDPCDVEELIYLSRL